MVSIYRTFCTGDCEVWEPRTTNVDVRGESLYKDFDSSTKDCALDWTGGDLTVHRRCRERTEILESSCPCDFHYDHFTKSQDVETETLLAFGETVTTDWG